jgi:DNA-binding MarR family transcriptional regulator
LKTYDSIGFILNTTGRRFSQLVSNQFSPYGITPEQFTVLRRLAEQNGISQKELSIRAEKDQTNITRIVDQLEKKGLVRRETDKEDRRSFLTYITAEGKVLLEKLIPIEAGVEKEALTGLSKEDIELCRRILIQINENVKNNINR